MGHKKTATLGSPFFMTSSYRIDRLFRVPDVDQRADGCFGQFAAAFEPGFNSGTLLFGYRATFLQANQTEVVAANIAQTVGFHGFFQERVEESINGFISQIFFEIQVQFETQLLILTNYIFLPFLM
ncbi:hypothetical protein SAMN04489798_3075 [Pseudomonas arsenicoxydans]|uniref:Uncharacterized protein n=1 Tax=Pseudomonas arsenicoxydans TaxID=702115 RepID=A0A1H0JXF2_9PSED|nr:hypothetical protein SAMN04489798_3075 [Pseudomonas arsenicoxydans]